MNGSIRFILLAMLVATCGLWGHARAQDPDPDEQAAEEAGDDQDDAAQADDQDDVADEATDDDVDDQDDAADHEAADADDQDDAADTTATTDDEDGAANDGADDGAVDVADTAADDAAVDAFDYQDGSTPADEFMSSDWAPEVPVNEADDALPTDTRLDPSGAGWEVVPQSQVSGGPGKHHGPAHARKGDYAGPSDIMVMRPRKAAPGKSAPGSRPASDDGKDTAYSYGGNPIAPGSAPWQVQIYRSLAQPKPDVPRWKAQHNCGGTLIAPDWVLTAAHCVDDIIDDKDAGWRVRLGGEDLAKEDGATYVVDRWVRHSGYKNVGHPIAPKPPIPPPNMYAHDIGLVHFKADAQTKPIADPKRVRAIQLYRKPIRGGDEVTAIGWGMTSVTAKSFSAVPLKVDLRVMDTPVCQARAGYGPERISGSVICAARVGQKTCRGDSGGPVILTNGTTANLVGLVSWGKTDCSGDGRPSVFTRVENYLGWIDQAMKLPETRASLP